MSETQLLVDEQTTATATHLSLSWLQKDRVGQKRIPFVKLGGSVRYHLPSVLAALLALQQGGNATPRQTRAKKTTTAKN